VDLTSMVLDGGVPDRRQAYLFRHKIACIVLGERSSTLCSSWWGPKKIGFECRQLPCVCMLCQFSASITPR